MVILTGGIRHGYLPTWACITARSEERMALRW